MHRVLVLLSRFYGSWALREGATYASIPLIPSAIDMRLDLHETLRRDLVNRWTGLPEALPSDRCDYVHLKQRSGPLRVSR